MAWTCYNTGSNCRSRGGIPVVSRKGRRHRSSEVSEAGTIHYVKSISFLDACRSPQPTPNPHPTPTPTPTPTPPTQHRVIQTGSSRQGHPDRVIQTGSSRQGHPDRVIQTGSSIKNHTHIACILFLFCVTRSHTYLQL
jgi:hypothetical protein